MQVLQRSLARSLYGIGDSLRRIATHDEAIVVCLPQLSPSMKSGKIRNWLKSPGDQIRLYDVFLEVDTDTLTEAANKVGSFEGSVTMLIESQEDVYLERTLVEAGKDIPIGTPIALVCEFEEDLPKLAEYQVHQLPSNLYGEDGDKVRMLTWQSYLKSDRGAGTNSCS